MKKLLSFKTLPLALLIAIISIQFISCGDDEDDTPAVLDREAFIGSYLGMFNCPGQLSFVSSDSLVFSIDPGIGADESSIILNLTVDGIPVALGGTVTGDTLNVMDQLTGVTIDVGIPVTGDVTGVGVATTNGTNLNGDITLTFDAGLAAFSDDCTITGIKQ